ncbi:hypothetical protein ABT160_36625 [Streptomyces sp. NPDC001941]|uniref:hypothetical protein n=1 Tax=Streptomyces sp. NPDC001941 TaxID=3154659 RepID=UPI003332A590
MRPESVDSVGEPNGSPLAVPLAWLSADLAADRLMRLAGPSGPGSLEHRCGRSALALTLYLSGTELPPTGPPDAARCLLPYFLTEDPERWADWVDEQLAWLSEDAARVVVRATCPYAEPAADTRMALRCWLRLRATELLPLLGEGAGSGAEDARSPWIPGWHLGAFLAHQVLRQVR